MQGNMNVKIAKMYNTKVINIGEESWLKVLLSPHVHEFHFEINFLASCVQQLQRIC